MCADADLQLAAKNIVKGGFSYSGQRCTAVKIVLVDKKVGAERGMPGSLASGCSSTALLLHRHRQCALASSCFVKQQSRASAHIVPLRSLPRRWRTSW